MMETSKNFTTNLRGVSKHLMAIRNFINYAFANQTQDPNTRYCLVNRWGTSYFKPTDSGILGYNQCLVASRQGSIRRDAGGSPLPASFTPRVHGG
ncbi:MAG: hypothetical protein IPN94_12140 [Sphingobacteriales bacterium]|nr:hypothetical protein [Sphingobacteriales bacterium]